MSPDHGGLCIHIYTHIFACVNLWNLCEINMFTWILSPKSSFVHMWFFTSPWSKRLWSGLDFSEFRGEKKPILPAKPLGLNNDIYIYIYIYRKYDDDDDVFLAVSKNAILGSPAQDFIRCTFLAQAEPTGSAWIAEVWRKFVQFFFGRFSSFVSCSLTWPFLETGANSIAILDNHGG